MRIAMLLGVAVIISNALLTGYSNMIFKLLQSVSFTGADARVSGM